MSFLTKLFVVLLVLSAMLLSATTVVFVQKTDDAGTRLKNAQIAQESAVVAQRTAESQKAALEQALNGQINILLSEKKGEEQKNTEFVQTIAGLQGQLATLNNSNATQQAQLTSLTEGVASAQSINESQKKEIADLSKDKEDSSNKLQDVNLALTEKTSVADNLTRQVRFDQEEISDLKAKVAALMQQVPASANQEGALVAPNGNVNGVVNEATIIGGVLYATISVGAADNVNPHTQLNVVKGGNFIGFITIKTVDAHSAVGSVQGPNLAPNAASIDTLKGAEVRSSL